MPLEMNHPQTGIRYIEKMILIFLSFSLCIGVSCLLLSMMSWRIDFISDAGLFKVVIINQRPILKISHGIYDKETKTMGSISRDFDFKIPP